MPRERVRRRLPPLGWVLQWGHGGFGEVAAVADLPSSRPSTRTAPGSRSRAAGFGKTPTTWCDARLLAQPPRGGPDLVPVRDGEVGECGDVACGVPNDGVPPTEGDCAAVCR